MKISTALIALGYLVLFLGILLGPSAALGDDCHDYSNHMRYVSRTLSGYDHQDIVLHGSYLLSVGPQNGLLVADISDPTDPFPVSSLWLDSYQFGLAAEGDLAAIMAYTSDDGEMEGEGPASGAVQLVDISDPAHPEFEGELTFRTAPDDIAMHNSHVYLAMRNLVIIDASNPAEPATVNRVPFINASEILISDGVAFVMDNLFDDSGVLHILDLTDPAEPLEIASLETAWTVNNMAIDENLLYLGCRQDAATGNLLVIDISDIADPFLVSTTALPMWPQALDVDNGVATIQCHLLTTYDVAQPEGPVKLGQTDSSTGASTILMRDGYAFLATGTHGVQIYDISHPTSADFIGS
ncbi:MAG: hypothetical protein KJ927_06715, partial [Candidatus Eisenbacteria bacterium]|nr:hypothetical protein [Candidatus Eisenbacteria bacterium]